MPTLRYFPSQGLPKVFNVHKPITTIGKTMGKKRYKSSTTTRNLRTLTKVLR